MSWTKIGRFEDTEDNNAELRHQVNYQSTLENPLVNKVYLCQYNNGILRIYLESNENRYNELVQQMVARGQESPSSLDRLTKLFRITAAPADKALLTRFLLDAISVDPSIADISDEIFRQINSVSSSAPIPSSNDADHRVFVYNNGHDHSSIQQHIDRLSLDTHLGRRSIDDELAIREQQNNNTEDAAHRNALDYSFAEYYGHTSATYLPSRNNATTAPALTDAEHKLFKEAEGKGYICPISLEIMTDPVSIKGHEKSGTFERSAIENWLRTSNRHPLTNLILTDKTLVPNTELKTAIEGFKTSKLKI